MCKWVTRYDDHVVLVYYPIVWRSHSIFKSHNQVHIKIFASKYVKSKCCIPVWILLLIWVIHCLYDFSLLFDFHTYSHTILQYNLTCLFHIYNVYEYNTSVYNLWKWTIIWEKVDWRLCCVLRLIGNISAIYRRRLLINGDHLWNFEVSLV